MSHVDLPSITIDLGSLSAQSFPLVNWTTKFLQAVFFLNLNRIQRGDDGGEDAMSNHLESLLVFNKLTAISEGGCSPEATTASNVIGTNDSCMS